MNGHTQRRYDLQDSKDAKGGIPHEDQSQHHTLKGNARIYDLIKDLGRYEGRGFQPRNVW